MPAPVLRGTTGKAYRMSLEPTAVGEPQNAAPFSGLTVVDRIALRMLRVQVYGTLREERYDHAARNQWDRVLDEEDRDTWRRVARELLADVALGDDLDIRPWPDYEVRHPDGDVHGGYDDISSASDFQANVWPEGKIYRRTTVTLGTEWTEVTA